MFFQKEEEKRKQKIEEWENLQDGKGYRSKVKPVSTPYTQFQAELEEKKNWMTCIISLVSQNTEFGCSSFWFLFQFPFFFVPNGETILDRYIKLND